MASLALPVLALIPVMTTMYDRARVRRNRILVSSAALLILGVAGVMLWTAERLATALGASPRHRQQHPAARLRRA